MNELSILESGVVPVYTTDKGEKVVDGRELWRGVKNKTDFSTWIKRRFDECEAVENKDYTLLPKIEEQPSGAKHTIEYIIKLPTAKEMAMLERNEVGKRVRKHFVAVEEKYNQQMIDTTALTPQMQILVQTVNALAASEIRQAKMERELAATTEKVEAVQNTLSLVQDTIISRDEDWRKWINDMFNRAVLNSPDKDFKALRLETYEELDRRAHSRTNIQLNNLRDRLRLQGATKTKIKNTTLLDVIEADVRLKEIYTAIIKELAIRYARAM